MTRTPTLAETGSDAGNLLQFLAWVAAQPRTYEETMDAWRTSCPRLCAWEDATTGGLVDVIREDGTARADATVRLTSKGAAWLDSARTAATRPEASGAARL
ncbi:hypothetical protein [Paraburkholderia phenazinium]|uniref:Winged helix DNA-binding domain-containing protein n=1 Tax=Paraburkholderia phenazinium TaxID=60549 RepID=A0A1G7SQ86_9BURK|nr:hypothetical protein [Paraburkholderia phenazinium]SDG24974.1 hypothetical protein SAMN05216466_102608 [Paraburkholderia phenazinium]